MDEPTVEGLLHLVYDNAGDSQGLVVDGHDQTSNVRGDGGQGVSQDGRDGSWGAGGTQGLKKIN